MEEQESAGCLAGKLVDYGLSRGRCGSVGSEFGKSKLFSDALGIGNALDVRIALAVICAEPGAAQSFKWPDHSVEYLAENTFNRDVLATEHFARLAGFQSNVDFGFHGVIGSGGKVLS